MANSQKQQEEDPFDSLFDLEEQHYSLGYAAGYRDGSAQSAIEGRVFGVEKGFEKFLLMGKLRRRAEVWAAEHIPDGSSSNTAGNADADADADVEGDSNTDNRSSATTTTTATVASANANPRLDRHLATLLMLTDPATLDKSNTDDSVAAFDNRLKRAQAKVKVIEKILGEHRGPARSSASATPAADTGSTAVGAMADIENLKIGPG